jgi:mRNA interferase RelE/StbE
MNLIYKKSFLKDLKNIEKEDSKRLKKLLEFLEENSKNDIFYILAPKKLSWYSDYFRIRLWDYRLWIKITSDSMEIVRFKHRKDIYKIFP